MQTFIKIQNRRINVIYISYYEVNFDDDKANPSHSIKIKMKDGGYKDELDFHYRNAVATKRFQEDLRKLDGILLCHDTGGK